MHRRFAADQVEVGRSFSAPPVDQSCKLAGRKSPPPAGIDDCLPGVAELAAHVAAGEEDLVRRYERWLLSPKDLLKEITAPAADSAEARLPICPVCPTPPLAQRTFPEQAVSKLDLQIENRWAGPPRRGRLIVDGPQLGCAEAV